MAGKLVFERPDAQTPGYLRRARRGLEFKARMAQGIDPEAIDEMVDYLLEFVTEPEDREEAKKVLFDANEEQFNAMIDALTGENQVENPTVDGKPSTKLEPLEKEQQP